MEILLTDEERNRRITNPDDIYPILRNIFKRENKIGREKEHFWITGLSSVGTLLYIELAALGSANRVSLTSADVFRLALIKGATSIIAAHNHPGGSLKFSPEDLDFSSWMIHAGKFLRVNLTDHLIITETEYTSLCKLGLYDEIVRDTSKVDPYIRHELEVIDAENKIRLENTERLRSIAIELQKNNIPVEKIAEIINADICVVESLLHIDQSPQTP